MNSKTLVSSDRKKEDLVYLQQKTTGNFGGYECQKEVNSIHDPFFDSHKKVIDIENQQKNESIITLGPNPYDLDQGEMFKF